MTSARSSLRQNYDTPLVVEKMRISIEGNGFNYNIFFCVFLSPSFRVCDRAFL